MDDMKMIWCTCTDCGKQFYGKGHRTVCDECKVIHAKQSALKYNNKLKAEGRKRPPQENRYTCQHCGTGTHDSKEVCSNCKEKYRLWGIIINMVKREKEKRDAGLETETETN